MKNKIIVLALVSVALCSCKKESKPQTTDEMKSEVPQEALPAVAECYEYVQGKDTIQANLVVQNSNISGDLIYQLFEKDKNSGKVVGTINGDTLLAEYTFMSEGIESTRQVVFFKKE